MPIAFRSSGEDPRVSAKRLSAPVTHQRLVLNKAGFWPAQAPARTALLAAALLGMAGIGAGCSSDSPVSALVKDDDSRDSHSDARELPQGVIAPYQPVQPGDARLGADGHYDYTAVDFVLRHPCDDQELMAKLREKGWEKDPDFRASIDSEVAKGCLLKSERENSIPIILHSQRTGILEKETETKFSRSDYPVRDEFYAAKLQTMLGEMCFVGQDTSHGTIGFTVNYSDVYLLKTEYAACNYLNDQINHIYGG